MAAFSDPPMTTSMDFSNLLGNYEAPSCLGGSNNALGDIMDAVDIPVIGISDEGDEDEEDVVVDDDGEEYAGPEQKLQVSVLQGL